MQLTNQIVSPVNPPNDSVLTLEDAKDHLEVEESYTADDKKIRRYLKGAIKAAEQYIAGHIYNKTLTLVYDGLTTTNVIFEAFPVRDIVSVQYYQTEATELTILPSTEYYLVNQNLRVQKIVFKNLPEDIDAERKDAVQIQLNVGFVDAEAVPEDIKNAIRLKVGEAFERREDRKANHSKASNALLRPYRKYT